MFRKGIKIIYSASTKNNKTLILLLGISSENGGVNIIIYAEKNNYQLLKLWKWGL